jgi:DNA-binding response OmpR family regulator
MTRQRAADNPILFMVEDEEDTANLLKMIMEEEGYQVIHAADGRQAQKQIAALPPPALVLLDMGLPHVQGLELLAQIRKSPIWIDVPVVILTADADKTDICKAIVAGATEYILKPFKREALVARLQRFRIASSTRRGP